MLSPRVGTPPNGASRGAAVQSRAGHFRQWRGSEPGRMPIRYERDDTRRRVVVTMDGPFNTAVFQSVSELHSPDTWRYGMLFDLRGMTGEPSIDELRQIMSQSAARQPGTGPRSCGDPRDRSGPLRPDVRVCGTPTRHADDRGVSLSGQGGGMAHHTTRTMTFVAVEQILAGALR